MSCTYLFRRLKSNANVLSKHAIGAIEVLGLARCPVLGPTSSIPHKQTLDSGVTHMLVAVVQAACSPSLSLPPTFPQIELTLLRSGLMPPLQLSTRYSQSWMDGLRKWFSPVQAKVVMGNPMASRIAAVTRTSEQNTTVQPQRHPDESVCNRATQSLR